jgi:GTP-binding protein
MKIPTRCLIGLRSELTNLTRGNSKITLQYQLGGLIMNNIFHSYQKYKGVMEKTRRGVMVSLTKGKATAFALEPLDSRGLLFISPQTPCYEGMIVGLSAKEQDVNVLIL